MRLFLNLCLISIIYAPDETLFIDDTKEHIESAKCLDLQTWHLNPKTDDVTQLFEQKHLNL